MVGVAQDDERDMSSLAASVEIDTKESAPGAARCQCGLCARAIICVASDVEDEGLKV